jgi:uncharacterized protein YjbJ (UPF0337 family)
LLIKLNSGAGLSATDAGKAVSDQPDNDWRAAVTDETGPEAAVKGVAEDVKGKVKEAAGAVTGNESLKSEGRAQQDKAAAEREVAAREAEAEKARAKAAAAEADERAHQ